MSRVNSIIATLMEPAPLAFLGAMVLLMVVPELYRRSHVTIGRLCGLVAVPTLLAFALVEVGSRWSDLTGQSVKVAPVVLAFPALGFLWLVGHLYLLHYYADRAQSSKPVELPTLLRAQGALVTGVLAKVEQVRQGGEAVLVPIEGRWGQGKTAALRSVAQRLEKDRRNVVVWVDVWRWQSEGDLLAAIYEELLAKPQSLYRWKWTLLPLELIPRRLGRELSRVKMGIKLPFVGVDVAADGRPTPLPWHGAFEGAVKRLRRSACVVTVILDEIDRAAPSATQNALTLTRRSLLLPGVVVLLPFVREQLRYKAFNPLIVENVDLTSAFDAVMWDVFVENPPTHEPMYIDTGDLVHAQLTMEYAAAGRPIRRLLERQFEEKYVMEDKFVLGPLSGWDLVLLVRHQDPLEKFATSIERQGQIEEALDDYMNGLGTGPVTVRQFRSAFGRVMDEWNNDPQFIGNHSDGELLMLAMLAYFYAHSWTSA